MPKNKSVKISTVNVIEYVDGTIQSVRSFADIKQGNKEAEDVFAACVRENAGQAFTDEELGEFMDDGRFEEGTYEIYITHSEK